MDNPISITEIIALIKANWGTIVTVLGVLGIGIEVVPVIKINPVSWILKRIGNMLNAELLIKVDRLEKDFHDHLEAEDMKEINDIRKEIVSFSLACQRNEHHTRDEFHRIFKRIDDYHALLKKHKMENGHIDIEVRYINQIYMDCEKEHRFFGG